jgi:hypothetical protein
MLVASINEIIEEEIENQWNRIASF